MRVATTILVAACAVAVNAQDLSLYGRGVEGIKGLFSAAPPEDDSTLAMPTTPIVIDVETRCYAEPAGAVARRWDDVNTKRSSALCDAFGYLKHPSERVVIYDVQEQRCADTCVCQGGSSSGFKCEVFAWRANGFPHTDGIIRGKCIMWDETLAEMDFVAGPSPHGEREHTFYSRSCYVRGREPHKSIQTTMTPSATHPPKVRYTRYPGEAKDPKEKEHTNEPREPSPQGIMPRSPVVDIDSDLIIAMEQL